MTKIEATYFGQASCSDSNSTSPPSGSLGLDSFWGLFLIVGIASSSALLLFTSVFFYANRDVLFNPDDTLPEKLRKLAQRFDGRDLTSHTFRQAAGATVPPSGPLSISDRPDGNFFQFREQGTSTVDSGTPDRSGEISEEMPDGPPGLELNGEPNQEEERNAR